MIGDSPGADVEDGRAAGNVGRGRTAVAYGCAQPRCRGR